MIAPNETYNNLLAKLKTYRNKVKQLAVLKGFYTWGSVTLAAVLFVCVIEAIFTLPPISRHALDIFFIMVVVSAFLAYWGRALVIFLFKPNHPSLIKTAVDVGRLYEDVNDRLANGLQVFEKQNHNPEQYSSALIEDSIVKAAEPLIDKDFKQKVDRKKVHSSAKLFAVIVGFFLTNWLLFPSTFSQASNRLLHPNRSFVVKPDITIQVFPGDVSILKGEDVEVEAVVRGRSVDKVSLHIRRANLVDEDIRILQTKEGDTLRYTIKSIKDSINYFVRAGKIESPLYAISVTELPMIRNLQVKLTPPQYSGISSHFLEENVGDVSALKGTKVSITATANKTLDTAHLLVNDRKKIPLNILGSEIKGFFRIEEDGTYYFTLYDRKGNRNANPINYRITVLPDTPPVVRIPMPGKDVDIGEDMLLPLLVEAEDDYGFSMLRLAYQVFEAGAVTRDSSDIHYIKLPGYHAKEQQIRVPFNWDIGDLGLLPEDVVMYYAEVYDNDSVTGPKPARSKTFRIRFPSMYEIYEEMAATHDAAFESLEQVYERSLELKKRLDNLAQEMKKDPELSWEERKELEDVIENQESMREQIEELAEQMDDMLKDMERNDLLALETLEKYQELQELFEEMMTPEMKEAMQEIAKAMEQIDPQKLKQAIEKLNFSQEDFLKSVERTISILKRLQIEQQLDEAIRKTQDLLNRQQDVDQKSQQGEQSLGDLAKKQNEIKEDTEQLSELMKDLQDKMSEFPDMPQEKMLEAQSAMDSVDLTQEMENMSQMLMSGQRSSAQQQGQKLENSLQQVSQSLQAAQQQMASGLKQEVMQALRRSAHDLLRLSKKQEGLMENTQGLNRNSPQMAEMAEQQQETLAGLSRVMNNMYELSKKTFFITPQLGLAMGKAAANMGKAIQSLEKRNSKGSAGFQGQSMADLNSAISQIRDSMNQCQGSCGSGMGLSQFLQRLKAMAGQQEGINQETMGFGSGGMFSLEQQAAMSRLAAQQEALRKSLEDLLREAGGRSETLGRLDQTLKDMESVVSDFNSKRIDQRTVERQRRIHSRLLDAQRSVRERDYSRKREAETGKHYLAIDPGQLPTNLGERENFLREDLLRAKREGYSKDYLELIRKYYEALSKGEVQR